MPFPSTAEMGWRWLRSRVPRRTVRLPVRIGPALRRPGRARALETAYCAEVVAMTYWAMGLLRPGRNPSWYDPGRFWSGDTLRLTRGARLGEEIAVTIPPWLASAYMTIVDGRCVRT